MTTHFSRPAFLALLCAVVFIGTASGHGFMTQPRCRGALNTQRSIVPQVIDANAPIDYCPHCQNCGGTGMVGKEGAWKMYNPFLYVRTGLTMCGDPVGKNDHTSNGQYANPASMPFAATYEAGSVANFEFDFTTNHCGFLSFYLCDVSKTTDKDINSDPEFWKANCHELKRVAHAGCESGDDMDCGPIDPKHPGRFVVPCRNAKLSDQVIGGPNGKMAYQIPDVEMSHAVVQAYWMTGNNCNPPDGFMDNYNFPKAWAGCSGDGGSVGGHITGRDCSGSTPEEFLNCADVRIVAKGSLGSGSGTASPSPRSPPPTLSSSLPSDTPKAQPTPVQTYTPSTMPTPVGTTTGQAGNGRGSEGTTTVPTLYRTSVVTTSTTSTTSSLRSSSTSSRIVTSAYAVAPIVSTGPSTMKNHTPEKAGCIALWEQCGGTGLSGANECCDASSHCVKLSESYSQCQSAI